jgi:hypothetical protein
MIATLLGGIMRWDARDPRAASAIVCPRRRSRFRSSTARCPSSMKPFVCATRKPGIAATCTRSPPLAFLGGPCPAAAAGSWTCGDGGKTLFLKANTALRARLAGRGRGLRAPRASGRARLASRAKGASRPARAMKRRTPLGAGACATWSTSSTGTTSGSTTTPSVATFARLRMFRPAAGAVSAPERGSEFAPVPRCVDAVHGGIPASLGGGSRRARGRLRKYD